jgi:hypothetical protein
LFAMMSSSLSLAVFPLWVLKMPFNILHVLQVSYRRKAILNFGAPAFAGRLNVELRASLLVTSVLQEGWTLFAEATRDYKRGECAGWEVFSA